NLLFGMLIAKEKLVTVIRPKRNSLHPSGPSVPKFPSFEPSPTQDIHLVINMISSSTSFQSVESWTPICLPKFNNRAFLHTYISFLGPDLCLVCLSPNKDAFFEMSDYRHRIAQTLEGTNCVEGIDDAIRDDGYNIVDLEVPGLRHFVFKSRNLGQYTVPARSPPYTMERDWQRLLTLYQYAHGKMHQRELPAKTVFQVTEAETVIATLTTTYEAYATFGPLVSKATAASGLHAMTKWARRQRHHDALFITNSPVF
ncbi:vacuolar fusion protein MON1, partial [Blyttiomyces helicus]